MELQSGTVLPEQKIIPLKQNAPPLELLEEELLELEEVKHSHLQVVKLGMQPISRGQIIGPQPELEELEIIPLLLEEEELLEEELLEEDELEEDELDELEEEVHIKSD